jgi:UDP-N-acetylmuramoyl-tripeptide--D-alanyl-D-alanine ligase
MMAFATVPLLTLPEVERMAQGDLVAREVPGTPLEREAFLRSGVDGVSIDTRTLTPGQLFVPLRGGHSDGHRFLAEAFRKGAALALCERGAYAELEGWEPGPLVLVEDATAALQRLAAQYREGWSGLMIGVTGSSGKTTTKDLVAAVLATAAPTLKTEGNLNNHWGVPLTLLRLRPEHRSAVVELATSHPGEIALLARLVKSEAAIITNAGSAHLEGMGTLAAIAAEKASLAAAVPAGRPVFAGADSERLMAALTAMKVRIVSYGFAARAALRPQAYTDLGPEGARFTVAGFPPVRLHLVGRHQVQNALGALAVAREYQIDPGAAAAALEAQRPAKGRMEVRTVAGATLLVDCYNANPDSTLAALETLAAWPSGTRRIAVLGDMLELGPEAAALHRKTGAQVRQAALWVVGAHAADYAAGGKKAGVETRVFEDKASLAGALRAELGPGTVVLLKASRGAALEEVLDHVVEHGVEHPGGGR